MLKVLLTAILVVTLSLTFVVICPFMMLTFDFDLLERIVNAYDKSFESIWK